MAGSDVIRVVVIGLGTVGKAAIRLCAMRPWLDVVGVVGRSVGATTGEELGLREGVLVTYDLEHVLGEVEADVALIATRPTIGEVIDDVERCLRHGVHVICTSEELAYPPRAAKDRLDGIAREHGVVVAATGINPGFVFDALPLAVSGAAWDVERITVSRTLDASVFGPTIHRSLGVGYLPEEFTEALAAGTIRGHIGFAESAAVIAGAMGLSVERFEERVEPVFTETTYELRQHRIEAGRSAGVTQQAHAWVGGREEPWLQFDLSLHVDPAAVGWVTADRILVEGENTIDVSISPGTQAVRTTAARLVNTIREVLAAPPGFRQAADLLPAAPWLGSTPPK